MRKGLLSHHELTFDIDTKDLVDVLAFDIRDVIEVLDAAVGHYNVDAAELLHGRFEELSNRLGVRDVSFDADGTNTLAAALLGNRFGCFGG